MPIIININPANIRLLHIVLKKKLKEKNKSCTITLLNSVYVHAHFISYCIKFIDFFGFWVFASVVDKFYGMSRYMQGILVDQFLANIFSMDI